MSRILPDWRRGIILTTSNGIVFNFRDKTLIIDANNTPEGLIHAIIPMNNINFMCDILDKLINKKSINNFFSIYLEYGSYGVIYPSILPMSNDHIRDIVYSILFENDHDLGTVKINCYSVLDNLPSDMKSIPVISEHLIDVSVVESAIRTRI